MLMNIPFSTSKCIADHTLAPTKLGVAMDESWPKKWEQTESVQGN